MMQSNEKRHDDRKTDNTDAQFLYYIVEKFDRNWVIYRLIRLIISDRCINNLYYSFKIAWKINLLYFSSSMILYIINDIFPLNL
jgi:hypothetical protein